MFLLEKEKGLLLLLNSSYHSTYFLKLAEKINKIEVSEYLQRVLNS